MSEREEQAAFCRREHPRLVGALSLYTGDAELARELAQEALARVCRDWRKVAGLRAPGAWAHRVAINLANRHFTRRRLERRAVARRGADETVAGGADTADVLAVRAAVAALPRRQRTALVLRYYADLPVREVADLMGCAPGTVKALTSQAISRLRAAELVDAAATPTDAEEVPDAR